jgi:predicted DNA-binding transcriptional regulator YafY
MISKRIRFNSLKYRLYTTRPPLSAYHFDTFKLVHKLEKQEFTREQSEAIMVALRAVLTDSMTELTTPMVTKAEQEKVGRS